jgi:hypothetical protein
MPRIRCHPAGLLAAIVWLLIPASADAQERGAVSVATVSPRTAQVGTPVSVSVGGKNPCGAVHIDWADGTALTYPIVDLTTTHKHTYEKAGTYRIVARGMGNCDGVTDVTVRIDPAPPAAERAQLTSLTVSIPGPVGASIGVTAHGNGRCPVTVDFGDGKSERLTVPFPHTFRHVYSEPGSYSVVATAAAPCEGRHTVKMDVGREEPRLRLLGLRIQPAPAAPRARVTITLDGRGTCPVTVDFGDGRDQRIESSLPARITHAYARPGLYEVYAWTESPCSGEATGSIRVRR